MTTQEAVCNIIKAKTYTEQEMAILSALALGQITSEQLDAIEKILE